MLEREREKKTQTYLSPSDKGVTLIIHRADGCFISHSKHTQKNWRQLADVVCVCLHVAKR